MMPARRLTPGERKRRQEEQWAERKHNDPKLRSFHEEQAAKCKAEEAKCKAEEAERKQREAEEVKRTIRQKFELSNVMLNNRK